MWLLSPRLQCNDDGNVLVLVLFPTSGAALMLCWCFLQPVSMKAKPFRSKDSFGLCSEPRDRQTPTATIRPVFPHVGWVIFRCVVCVKASAIVSSAGFPHRLFCTFSTQEKQTETLRICPLFTVLYVDRMTRRKLWRLPMQSRFVQSHKRNSDLYIQHPKAMIFWEKPRRC